MPIFDCRSIPFESVQFLMMINIPGQVCGCMLDKWCLRFVGNLMTFLCILSDTLCKVSFFIKSQ